MTEQKTTIVGGDVHRTTISAEIESALRQAIERIDRIDTDPIMRLAMARVSVRTFASDMIATYPEFTQDRKNGGNDKRQRRASRRDKARADGRGSIGPIGREHRRHYGC